MAKIRKNHSLTQYIDDIIVAIGTRECAKETNKTNPSVVSMLYIHLRRK